MNEFNGKTWMVSTCEGLVAVPAQNVNITPSGVLMFSNTLTDLVLALAPGQWFRIHPAPPPAPPPETQN